MGLCNAIDEASCNADWGQTCDNSLDQVFCDETCWKVSGAFSVLAAITGLVLGILAQTQVISFLDPNLIQPFIIAGSTITAVALFVLFYNVCRPQEKEN
jgi:hypothetical protein